VEVKEAQVLCALWMVWSWTNNDVRTDAERKTGHSHASFCCCLGFCFLPYAYYYYNYDYYYLCDRCPRHTQWERRHKRENKKNNTIEQRKEIVQLGVRCSRCSFACSRLCVDGKRNNNFATDISYPLRVDLSLFSLSCSLSVSSIQTKQLFACL